MPHTLLMFFVLMLIAKKCSASLSTKTIKLDESLVEASIEILGSCYTDRFSTVGIAGPSAGSIIRRISSGTSVNPIASVDETSRSPCYDPVDLTSRNKLQVFMVGVTEPNSLVETLVQLKNSTWWNHMASFLLIDLAGTKNGCSNAYEVLWEAWKMNLLKVNFMCFHETKGTLIYTFNPYTGEAPEPWQRENTYKRMSDHVWTLFVQEYHKDASPCDRLDFDKTIDVGGYEIRAGVIGMEYWWSADPTKKPLSHHRISNVTIQLLVDSLNATWKIQSYSNPNEKPQNATVYENKMEMDILSGIIDIVWNIAMLHSSVSYSQSYPISLIELAVVTRYQGYKSQLVKLISLLDKRSRFGVFVVLMLTVLIFKFWLRKPLTPAILDLVRLICNAGLRTISRNTAPRIYLASLFILSVTIQGIYSGQLASLLTKKIRLPPVNSIGDLAHSDHIIYGQSFWLSFFDQSTFEDRLVEIFTFSCTKEILDDPKAACALAKIGLVSIAARYNLHLSRAHMGGFYGCYPIRNDWPLEDRLNTIHERLVAGGIWNLVYARELQSELNIVESYELQYQEPELKVLTLDHLGFAFIILAIGLGCATVAFIIEVATFGTPIARLPKRIRRIHRMNS